MKPILMILASILVVSGCESKPLPNQPAIEVWKSPTCSCCSKWVSHLRDNGFAVSVHNQTEMSALKSTLGVPRELASCHTALVDGYVIEGHVPAKDIHRLLAEKPEAAGLAVPGMPIGSPGMEQGDRQDPYTTVLFDTRGQSTAFQSHGETQR